MEAAAVADYLRHHPNFFEEYADLIADIYIPHPHGGHAIPIAERQILTLREKSVQLEAKLKELVRFGNENDVTSERLHRSTLALLASRDLESAIRTLYQSLRTDFEVPQTAVRLWGRVPEGSYLPELAACSQEMRDYVANLAEPYCGPLPAFESREWLEEIDACRSFAYLPLRNPLVFGVLVLGSDDPERFYPSMGTLYLMRLAELTSVTLARYLPETR